MSGAGADGSALLLALCAALAAGALACQILGMLARYAFARLKRGARPW